MDEIDAIGGRRFSEGTSADREIQRTLMELLNQLDGFDQLGKVLEFSFMLIIQNKWMQTYLSFRPCKSFLWQMANEQSYLIMF